MKSVEVIQEVKILPRAQASHRPGSETRWREETNVRSRVEQGSRVYIEPRKLCEIRGPARDNHPRRPAPRVWEPRTVSRHWNAVSAPSLSARQGRGHRGRRPDVTSVSTSSKISRISFTGCSTQSGSKTHESSCFASATIGRPSMSLPDRTCDFSRTSQTI